SVLPPLRRGGQGGFFRAGPCVCNPIVSRCSPVGEGSMKRLPDDSAVESSGSSPSVVVNSGFPGGFLLPHVPSLPVGFDLERRIPRNLIEIIHDRLANPTGWPRSLVSGESTIREGFAARSERDLAAEVSGSIANRGYP